MTERPPLFVGINLPAKYGVSDGVVVDKALEQGYDMVTSRLTSRSYRKRIQALFHELEDSHVQFAADPDPPDGAGAPSVASSVLSLSSGPPAPELDDVVIHPGPHVANTIALAAPWVEIDSKNATVANLSLQVLSYELAYACFCGLPYVVISGPKRRTNVVQYAQALNSLLLANPALQVSIHLPLTEEFTLSAAGILIPPNDYLSVWEVWNTIRSICNYPNNLSAALQLPKTSLPDFVISRWFAEPVSMIIVSCRTFVPNQKGYPVLPKYAQQILHLFFKINPFFIIEDAHDSDFVGGETAFMVYLRHLHDNAPDPSAMELLAQGYTDFLQAPLQPLADDLDSSMYEVFERDPVKYSLYEKAVFHALLDRPTKHITVAVLGAGRGPLVDRVLKAAAAANRTVSVYAVEKNSSAYLYLLRKKAREWGDTVKVVRADMRSWHPRDAPKINIIVSELLGSFGDNELSPECLDCSQWLLDPDDGIMIPSSYTAYFTPVYAPKLYSVAWTINDKGGRGARTQSAASGGFSPGMGNPQALHSPYVVMMQQVDRFSEQIAKAWSFTHPVPVPADTLAHTTGTSLHNMHNTRKCRTTFTIVHKTVCHGLAGYFEAVLYKDIQLSTRPDTIEAKSKDMTSWFPIWFPFAQPLNLCDSSELDVSMWRCTDGKRVWYEWAAEAHALIPTSSARDSPVRRMRTGTTICHNPNGQFFSMSL